MSSKHEQNHYSSIGWWVVGSRNMLILQGTWEVWDRPGAGTGVDATGRLDIGH